MRTTGDGVELRAAVLVGLLALGTVLALTLDLPGVAEVCAWLDGAGPAGWTAMMAGLTAIRWAPYVAGTALGLVPSTLLQVGVGASAGAVLDRTTPLTVLPLLGAVVVLTALAAGTWRRRRRTATT